MPGYCGSCGEGVLVLRGGQWAEPNRAVPHTPAPRDEGVSEAAEHSRLHADQQRGPACAGWACGQRSGGSARSVVCRRVTEGAERLHGVLPMGRHNQQGGKTEGIYDPIGEHPDHTDEESRAALGVEV